MSWRLRFPYTYSCLRGSTEPFKSKDDDESDVVYNIYFRIFEWMISSCTNGYLWILRWFLIPISTSCLGSSSMNKNRRIFVKINKSHHACALAGSKHLSFVEVRDAITQPERTVILFHHPNLTCDAASPSTYVATLNRHYKFNTRSELYTLACQPFSIKNYSRDVLLRSANNNWCPAQVTRSYAHSTVFCVVIPSLAGSIIRHNRGRQIDCGTKIGSSSSSSGRLLSK